MSQPETPAPEPAPRVITLGRAGKKTTLGGRTRVIVPLTGDAASLRSQVAALASSRADIAEWRADTFLASLVGSHFVAAADIQSELTSAARYVTDASPVPVLATIRTFVEGGQAYLDDEEYCALVRCLAPLVGAVDVEISRDGAASLIEDAHGSGALAVASFHDFEATPSDEVLAEVLAAMNHAGADVLKFACTATSAMLAPRTSTSEPTPSMCHSSGLLLRMISTSARSAGTPRSGVVTENTGPWGTPPRCARMTPLASRTICRPSNSMGGNCCSKALMLRAVADPPSSASAASAGLVRALISCCSRRSRRNSASARAVSSISRSTDVQA